MEGMKRWNTNLVRSASEFLADLDCWMKDVANRKTSVKTAQTVVEEAKAVFSQKVQRKVVFSQKVKCKAVFSQKVKRKVVFSQKVKCKAVFSQKVKSKVVF